MTLTREAILEMPAGPEMDALVAEKESRVALLATLEGGKE